MGRMVREQAITHSPTKEYANSSTSVSALSAMSRRTRRPGRLVGINGSRGVDMYHYSGINFYAALEPQTDATRHQVVEDDVPGDDAHGINQLEQTMNTEKPHQKGETR